MGSETKTTEAPGLRRELKARHLTMIAIGGSIGTGLFVASGATISQAGPGGALLSYGHELVVPGYTGLDLECVVPRRYLPVELHLCSRLW